MGKLTKEKSVLLDKLVGDCISYSLTPSQALEYIRREFGEIKVRVYFRRKKKLESDERVLAWLNHFTKIGFVQLHRKIMQDMELQIEDTKQTIYEEKQKPAEKRDEYLILKLKKHMNESYDYLGKMSVGSPVIAGVHAKIEKYRNGQNAPDVDFYFNEHNPFYKPVNPSP